MRFLKSIVIFGNFRRDENTGYGVCFPRDYQLVFIDVICSGYFSVISCGLCSRPMDHLTCTSFATRQLAYNERICSHSIVSICCGFIVQTVVRQIDNKSNQSSLCTTGSCSCVSQFQTAQF